MSFTKGIKAHIFVSWLHPYRERKVVIGERKTACKSGDFLQSECVQEEVLSLPMFPELTEQQIKLVSKEIVVVSFPEKEGYVRNG